MSQMTQQEAWGEFAEMVSIECGEFYFNEFGRLPTDEEQEKFWEEYLEGDIRVGEE